MAAAKSKAIVIAALAVVLAVSFAIQSHDSNRPWMNYRDANGATHGRIAKNYFKTGLKKFKLAPVYDSVPSELAPVFNVKWKGNPFFMVRDGRAFITHYPPTMNLIIYATYRVFGASPSTTRLLAVFITLAGAVFLFLFARRHVGDAAALAAVAMWTLSPMVLCYGQMTDTIVFINTFALGALWQYSVWAERRRPLNFILMCAFVAAGCSLGWYCYFLVPLIVAHHIFARRGRFSWALFFSLPAVAGACLTLFIAYLLWMAGPHAIGEWLAAYSVRRGDVIDINGVLHPISVFQFFKTFFLRIPFHFTWPAVLACIVWLWAARKRPEWRISRDAASAMLLLCVFGLMPVLFFRQGIYVHGFYLFLFGPAVAMCAGTAVSLLFKKYGSVAFAALAAVAVLFVLTCVPTYRLMTNYLVINQARGFSEFVDSVSDEKTVVAQDLFDLGMTIWISNSTDRFILQREMTQRDIRDIAGNLPPGYRMIYIHLPLPDSYRAAGTGDTLAWFYRNYGYRKVGGYFVFDTKLKPARHEAKTAPRIRTALRFQDRIELEGLDIRGSEGIRAGAAAVRPGKRLSITYNWKCLRSMPDSFIVLVKIIPGILHNDHEPQQSMYLTSHWRAGEALSETYNLDVPPDAPPGRYPVLLALCTRRDPKAYCLKLENEMHRPGQGFIKVAEIEVLPAAGGTKPVEVSAKLAKKMTDIDSYMEYADLSSFRRFMHFMSVDPAMAASFEGWQYLYEEDYDKAIPILTKLVSRFGKYGLIEMMVPTAMAEVPAMLKARLSMLLFERRHVFRASKQLLSLVFDLPASYQVYMRVGSQLDKKTKEAKQGKLVLLAMSDTLHRRMIEMKPSDEDTQLLVINHYIKTGRPQKAFQAARANLGAKRDFDVKVNAAFGAGALANGSTEDYRMLKLRMAALGRERDFEEMLFENLISNVYDDELVSFIGKAGSEKAKNDYWLRAMDYAWYNRNFVSLSLYVGMFDSKKPKLDPMDAKTVSRYFSTLAHVAYKSQNLVATFVFFEKAIKYDPLDTTSIYNLAVLYHTNGKSDKATVLLKKLLKINPGDRSAAELLEDIQEDSR